MIVQWSMDRVIAVSTDLFFAARIRSAAQAAGTSVRFIGRADDLPSSAPSLALVDLDSALDVAHIIAQLQSAGTPMIVAFGPHLDTEKFSAARGAGAHRVLARSKFVTELPALMRSVSTLAPS